MYHRVNLFFNRGLKTVLLLVVYKTVSAGSLIVQVTDKSGAALDNAVVYAEPAIAETKSKAPHVVDIAQRSRRFVPLVTVVQTGTLISFPNYDSIKHHVYSFSAAKMLDLPLYFGKPAAPQLFDKAGTVILGCNIHDRMIAYVQVVNTPYFGTSDAAGTVKLDGLPAGNYQLKAWYYGLPTNQQVMTQSVTLTDGPLNAAFKVNAMKSQPDGAGER